MYHYTFGYIVETDSEPSVPHLVLLACFPLPPDPQVSKSASVSSGVSFPLHYPIPTCASDAFGLPMSQGSGVMNDLGPCQS
jgi:hypothetical protein